MTTAKATLSQKQLDRLVKADEDREDIQRAREGDRKAFRRLVEKYQQRVARSVVAMLGPSSEVDDVVQDTFIKCYQSLDKFRGDASFATYVNKIAVNKSLDVLRRRKRFRGRFLSRDDEQHTLVEPTYDVHETTEKTALVHRAIQQLSPKHRAVIVLRVIEGYSTEETAGMLNLAYGTVLSRLSRAQKKLKELLEPHLS